MEMEYRERYEKAYQAMSETMIDGNCGELCKGHCCRRIMENGEPLGIYFLPFEYEVMQAGKNLIEPSTLEIHKSDDFELPEGIEQLVYGFCRDITQCDRELRPIQCRTYPFEPHIENGELELIIEKEQVHQCPLLSQRERWNPAFEKGILEGWKILLQIPEVRAVIVAESEERRNRDGK